MIMSVLYKVVLENVLFKKSLEKGALQLYFYFF